MMNTPTAFLRSQNGATAIEYAFIAAMVVTGIIGVVTLLGTQVNAMFVRVVQAFTGP